nr:hypothetical protein [Lacticaseibacillus nasuensis]
MKKSLNIDDKFFTEYNANYQNVINHLKKKAVDPDDGEDVQQLVEMDYELSLYKSDIIDYSYIMRLIASYSEQAGNLSEKQRDKHAEEIIDSINKFSANNPQVADILSDLWGKVKAGQLQSGDLMDEFNHELGSKLNTVLDDFSSKWMVNEDRLDYMARHYNSKAPIEEQPGFTEVKDTFDWKKYEETLEKKEKFPFKYTKQFKQDLDKTLREDVEPLMDI